jgi:FkbM family methyltransferase
MKSISKVFQIIKKKGLKKTIKLAFKKVFGKPEEIPKKKIKKILKNKNPTILEIGANNGNDTKKFLKLFSRAKIYCFEPDPRMIKKFKKNISAENVELVEKAISDREGKIQFYLSESKNPKIRGMDSSSIKRPKNHLDFFPSIKFNKKIKVETITLDKWIKENKISKVDFIWGDVQGAEKEMILGGLETLNNKTKYLYTEYSNRKLYDGELNLKEIKNY